MLSLLTLHNIVSQIMEISEYASQLKKLNDVAYLLLISFFFLLAKHIYISLAFASSNYVEHILIKINLCLFVSCCVWCCFIVSIIS